MSFVTRQTRKAIEPTITLRETDTDMEDTGSEIQMTETGSVADK